MIEEGQTKLFGAMFEQLNTLKSQVEELRRIVEPVLRPDEPRAENSPEKDRAEGSPVAYAIHRATLTMSDLSTELHRIAERMRVRGLDFG